MQLYKNKKVSYTGVWVTLLAFFCIMGYFLYGFANITKSLENQQCEALQEAISRALVSCYAIEGHYPLDITYIQEHYGIIIDEETYEIYYRASKGNKKPEVQVLLRGGTQE